MNTNTYAAPNTYTPAQTAPQKAPKVKIPGRGGAIARLIVMYLCVIIGFISGFGSLFTEEGSFGHVILSAIAGGNMISHLGVWIRVIVLGAGLTLLDV